MADDPDETQVTEVLPDVSAEADPPRARRRGRGWIIAGIVVAIVAIIAVVADIVARNVAESTIEVQAAKALPENVTGDIHASIGGFSVLAQLITGRAERVELTAPKLVVDGTPMAVDVVVRDIPIRLDGPTGRIDAEVDLDQDAVNRLAFAQGVPGGFTLGDGLVGYTGQLEILGFPVHYSASARAEAAGDAVLLTPTAVEVGSGAVALDLSEATQSVLGGDPLRICVAEQLPAGVEIAGIDVRKGEATVRLESTGLVLDAEHLKATGTCS
ncbi:DUF2993 domain-containing protein [Agromyces protaetiae]|uniref:DUF2993 domain-containing protein n=1 Tax=Agromyces protaetiae TaxID=2509455 RepID=A0A4P6FF61_9MICO|nr:DUF2993 domain-containing protein [Agromyces protaetiae]QAY74486.1 DUF2993 domain-containing protein [Agromyces protaetiae]